MKRLCVFIMLLIITLTGIASSAFAESNNSTESFVSSSMLNEGVYDITVKSSSSMFRIVNCSLHVNKNDMYAVMTLSGKGYEKLFMGTGEEALSASDDSFIFFAEDSEGKYTYTVPVEALDKEIDCAAWSIRKKKWYDRVLVFESQSLPEQAFKKQPDIMVTVIIIVGSLLVIMVIIILIKSLYKHKKQVVYDEN